jgi:hypothetical protein
LASDEFRCETDRFQKKYNGSNSIETTNAHDEEGERDPGEDRKRIPEMMNHKKNKTQHPTRKSGNEMASKGSNAKGNSVIGGEVPLGEKRVEIHPTTIECVHLATAVRFRVPERSVWCLSPWDVFLLSSPSSRERNCAFLFQRSVSCFEVSTVETKRFGLKGQKLSTA